MFQPIKQSIFLHLLSNQTSENKAKKREKSEKRLFVAQNPINPMGQVGFSRGGEG